LTALGNSAILLINMAVDKPITKTTLVETLNAYGEEVLLPRVEQIVDDKMKNYTDKILKSNDKVIKELKPLREEQQAIDENYKNLDERMDHVESFAEEAAGIVGVKFKKA